MLFSHGWEIIYWRLLKQWYPLPKDTVLIGVNGCCVMRSSIVEPDRNGDIIKITALSKEPGNPRLTKQNGYGKYRSK